MQAAFQMKWRAQIWMSIKLERNEWKELLDEGGLEKVSLSCYLVLLYKRKRLN
jgi:hypothetical protein